MYVANFYDPDPVQREHAVLTYYLPKEKIRKVKNLLTSNHEGQELEPEPIQSDEIVSHWHHVSCGLAKRLRFHNLHPELDFSLGLGCREDGYRQTTSSRCPAYVFMFPLKAAPIELPPRTQIYI